MRTRVTTAFLSVRDAPGVCRGDVLRALCGRSGARSDMADADGRRCRSLRHDPAQSDVLIEDRSKRARYAVVRNESARN
jgi:hypothetical protein